MSGVRSFAVAFNYLILNYSGVSTPGRIFGLTSANPSATCALCVRLCVLLEYA